MTRIDVRAQDDGETKAVELVVETVGEMPVFTRVILDPSQARDLHGQLGEALLALDDA